MNSKNEKPILYSASMIRAKLESRKTQTRRIFKLPSWVEWYEDMGGDKTGFVIPKDPKYRGWYSIDELPCPYGKVGDRLWARETWQYHPDFPEIANRFVYRADISSQFDVEKWRPSIYMPRCASRILDEITEIRIERLNDITAEDALAEGIEKNWIGPLDKGPNGFGGQGWCEECGWIDYLNTMDEDYAHTPIESYRSLWESINGKGSWNKNPFVWVITTKTIRIID